MSSNYIVFKNKYSGHIRGLLIQELPPIIKPKMRTTITKIDGRDGDIVDKLGYESYNKVVSIGLTRNFNIDEIMDFFNGDGDVIFSNEPDKVYKAQILDQVNYERLLRFKTAKVNFRVQPFKYLLNEPPFVFNITNETEVKVSNQGLVKSKPIITLYGSGTVNISINGLNVFSINIDSTYVTIDSLEQEAYKGLTLKNRMMTGEFPELETGINTISWTGTLTKIIVEPKSRWL